MTPHVADTTDDPIAVIQATLTATLDRAYRDPLESAFIGSSVEDWLPVRRLMEAGWTFAMVIEAILASRDGIGEGVGEVAEILRGGGA